MTPEDCIFKLGQLEPDEIARLMKDSGVVGYQTFPDSCVIANYIRQETGVEVILTGSTYTVMESCVNGNKEIDHPDSVIDFIGRFDSGKYPELDARLMENM